MNREQNNSAPDEELDLQTTRTIRQSLAAATRRLRRAGIADAGRDAATLLMLALDCDRTFLVVNPNLELNEDSQARFRRAIARRARREPVQYISNRQEFYNLEFEVTPDVLIPRPETELIVEAALELLRDNSAPRVCDVGTGSGAITVALLHEREDARAVALDVSVGALAVARRNAVRHNVDDRTRFVASDCFDALQHSERNAWQPFDVIVSNPPYIAEEELPALQPEVRDFEPRAALTPGTDALHVIKRILHDAPRFLVANGYLIFEIGFGQSRAVAELIDEVVWRLIDIQADLQNIARTFVLQKR